MVTHYVACVSGGCFGVSIHGFERLRQVALSQSTPPVDGRGGAQDIHAPKQNHCNAFFLFLYTTIAQSMPTKSLEGLPKSVSEKATKQLERITCQLSMCSSTESPSERGPRTLEHTGTVHLQDMYKWWSHDRNSL